MDVPDPIASEEQSEIKNTNSIEPDGVATNKQPATNTNVLGSDKDENLLSSNLEEEVTDANTSVKLHQLGSQESNSELPNASSETNVSSKSASESSAAEGGSHRSPDRKSKVEYRKIKSEVTGEGETSESEGEDNKKDTTKKDSPGLETTESGSDQPPESWMDILGNGLLKKRVKSFLKSSCHASSFPTPPPSGIE